MQASDQQKRNRPYADPPQNFDEVSNGGLINERWGLPADPEIRMGFVRKVFGLLTCQLLMTTLVAGACFAKRNDPKFVKLMANPGVLFGALGGFLATYIALVCCEVDKKVPVNYILLTIFTFCMSIMVGHAVMRVPDPSVVLAASAMTLGSVTSIMLYAVCSKSDFTVYAPALFQASLVFAICGLFVALFAPKMHYFLACGGVILFGIFLLVDTQIIMSGAYGGHRKYQIDEDSYIMATVILYLDIINLFLYILELLNQNDQ